MIYEYEITKSILLNNQDNEHMWLLFKKVEVYMEWIYLLLAIAFEIISTTLMKASNGFTKILPTIGMFLGYTICFGFLTIALKK